MQFRKKDIPPSFNFKYVKDTHNGLVIQRPKIEVRLSNGGEEIRLVMLVDSGADISLIPSYIADTLGLQITETKKSKSASGEFETGRSTVNIELMKWNKFYDLGKMDILVALKADVKLNTNLLLGRSFFFRRFDITFRECTYKLLLRKPKRS